MPRTQRVNENGFYHIINRGVAKNSIFCDFKDFEKFLEIMQEVSIEYNFKLYSFCLMGNHYHLLIEINNQNLSLTMQKINSRYSIYFNKKYKRVGPLWQGRFKSWYIYDSLYLHTLIKYIEQNPIKAGVVKDIGKYKWSMSSLGFDYAMLDYELINKIDLKEELTQNEMDKMDDFYHKKQKVQDSKKDKLKPLKEYFEKNSEKEIGIAICDGHSATSIARYLSLSNASITKKMKSYRQKMRLFEKLKKRGIFWSYDKNITYEKFSDDLLIEYVLKYADFDDMREAVAIFGKNATKRVWHKKLKSDKRFIKTNILIARVLFGLDVESDYFKEVKNERFEKLKLLAKEN